MKCDLRTVKHSLQTHSIRTDRQTVYNHSCHENILSPTYEMRFTDRKTLFTDRIPLLLIRTDRHMACTDRYCAGVLDNPRSWGAFPWLWRWGAPPPKPEKMSSTPEPRPYKRPQWLRRVVGEAGWGGKTLKWSKGGLALSIPPAFQLCVCLGNKFRLYFRATRPSGKLERGNQRSCLKKLVLTNWKLFFLLWFNLSSRRKKKKESHN